MRILSILTASPQPSSNVVGSCRCGILVLSKSLQTLSKNGGGIQEPMGDVFLFEPRCDASGKSGKCALKLRGHGSCRALPHLADSYRFFLYLCLMFPYCCRFEILGLVKSFRIMPNFVGNTQVSGFVNYPPIVSNHVNLVDFC